jgi:pimeloyl-ACP methyl ester carboxylesterase
VSTHSAAPIAGFRSETATVNGVRLHYWIGGEPEGQPVILWHGFLSTGYAWRDVAPALAKAGLSVLVPDMRGYGDSDKPAGNQGYDARSLAEECRKLMAAIGFGQGRALVHAAHDMGALPALIWSGDHPDEVAGLLYIEAPVTLGEVLRRVFAYTPEAMSQGSMWWWIVPLASGLPERLIVGIECAFLGWFYERDHVVNHAAISEAVVDEYLRTFAGTEGRARQRGHLSCSLRQHRADRETAGQKIRIPVVALGGENGLGAKVGEMVAMVAENVAAHTLTGCGDFMPEERPAFVIEHILSLCAQSVA